MDPLDIVKRAATGVAVDAFCSGTREGALMFDALAKITALRETSK